MNYILWYKRSLRTEVDHLLLIDTVFFIFLLSYNDVMISLAYVFLRSFTSRRVRSICFVLIIQTKTWFFSTYSIFLWQLNLRWFEKLLENMVVICEVQLVDHLLIVHFDSEHDIFFCALHCINSNSSKSKKKMLRLC
jgi:hypothetical protein